MNPSSPLDADGPIIGRATGTSPIPPPITPRPETAARQDALEAQVETLQRKMARMQERNIILSSKLDDTQKQLDDRRSHSARYQDDLEQTTQLRQEQSYKSIPKPNERDRGKGPAVSRPSSSRQLFVPSRGHRQEYQVYSDCRDRLNDRRKQRPQSPIPTNTRPGNQHMGTQASGSPNHRRYKTTGLEETDESDYAPTSPGTTISYRSPENYRRNQRTNGAVKNHDRESSEHDKDNYRTAGLGRPNVDAFHPVAERPQEHFGNDLPSTDPTIRLLFQKIHRIEEEQNQSRQPAWGKIQPGPFVNQIRTFKHEKDIRPLGIPFYTGIEDPVSHLHTFQSAVGCKGLTDEGQCLLFPSTLAGAALNWFFRLEPDTVSSFSQLKQTFLNHFMIQTDRLYSADDLYTIRQRNDEPLREYAARFSHEYSRCPETDDRVAFGAFKSGLRSSQFRYSVHSNNWTTYGELMKQAAIHAKAEHFNSKCGPSAPPSSSAPSDQAPVYDRFPSTLSAKPEPYRTAPPVSGPFPAGNKRKDGFQGRQDEGKHGKAHDGQSNFKGPKQNRPTEVFTLINTTYESVLMNENQMIPKPDNRKLPRQHDKDTGVFCRYHQYNGHDTESCIALRKIVERLISEGKLNQYLGDRPTSEPTANRRVNMISGGVPIAEASNRSIKNYVRAVRYPPVLSLSEGRNTKIRRIGWEPISFSEEEEKGIIFPHSDPMIIRADIADYDVGRILIDTGSSVNVLFTDAFNALGIEHRHLNKDITPLVSFSGDMVKPIGSIQLPLAIGTKPRRSVIYTHFLIVDCPTAYNAIIGRPALTRLKAVLSPHMLLLKFPTHFTSSVS